MPKRPVTHPPPLSAGWAAALGAGAADVAGEVVPAARAMANHSAIPFVVTHPNPPHGQDRQDNPISDSARNDAQVVSGKVRPHASARIGVPELKFAHDVPKQQEQGQPRCGGEQAATDGRILAKQISSRPLPTLKRRTMPAPEAEDVTSCRAQAAAAGNRGSSAAAWKPSNLSDPDDPAAACRRGPGPAAGETRRRSRRGSARVPCRTGSSASHTTR